MITLVRVDFRTVHAQVVQVWAKLKQVDTIYIIDDGLYKDVFLQNVFNASAPKDIKLVFMTFEKGAERFRDGYISIKNEMVIFKTINGAFQTIEQGMKVEELQVGGVPGGPGRKVVCNAVALNDDDYKMLQDLHNKGINIYFQTVPGLPAENYEEVMSRY